MTNKNSRTADDPTRAPITRLLDLLLSTAHNQRLALDLLQRHWPSAAAPAGVAPRAQPERTARAEPAPPDPPTRPIPTAEIGAQVLRALHALAAAGRLRVNEPAGHLYIDGAHVAAVVPHALRAVRAYLKAEGWTLPERIYDDLRAQGVALATDTGRLVRRLDVRVGTTWRSTDVRAILIPRTRLDGLAAHAGFEDVTFTEIPPAVSMTGNHSGAKEPVASAPTGAEPVHAAPKPDLYGYEAAHDARPHFGS